MFFRFILIFLMGLAVMLSGCATKGGAGAEELFPETGEEVTADGVLVLTMSTPISLSPLQVQQAVMNAAIERGWEVRRRTLEGENGRMELRRRNAFFETQLNVLHTPGLVEGFSDSYVLSPGRERKERFTPPHPIRLFREALKAQLERQIAGY